MPPFGLTFRDALETDLPEIVAIYNATIPSRIATADTAPVSVVSRQTWFREHHPATRPLWVLTDGTGVCAWLSFNSFYGRPAYQCTAEVSIYVAESQRRRGLAQWLLDEAIRRAPDCGIRSLLGFIWAHNAPSLDLFTRAGFQKWGHLPRVAVLDDIERDLMIVGRRVSP